MIDKLASIEGQYEKLMASLGTQQVQSDANEYRKQSKALAEIEPLVQKFREYKDVERDIAGATEAVKGHTEQEALIAYLQRLGTEFMPPLEEGDLLYMPTALPGLSAAKAGELLQLTDRMIRTVPEVEGVSSSAIRRLLHEGRMEEAAGQLGRPHEVEGIVVEGDARGGTLGFPTANLKLEGTMEPAYGVYAVRVRLADGAVHDGVANFGIRPMFELPTPLLEVHRLRIPELA